MSRSAPLRQSTRKIQYYVSVDGINYKRALLEHAESFANKGSITMEDAAQLWASAHDGNTVTKCEVRTLELILRKHEFEDRARSFLASVMFPGGPCLFTPAPAPGAHVPLALDRGGTDVPATLPGERDGPPPRDVELDAVMALSIAQERAPLNHDLEMDAAIAASLAESRPAFHDAAFDAGIAASLREEPKLPNNDDELDAAIAASLAEGPQTNGSVSGVGMATAACASEPPNPLGIPALAVALTRIVPSNSAVSAHPPLVAARGDAAAAMAAPPASTAPGQSIPDVAVGERRRSASSEMGPCPKRQRLEDSAARENSGGNSFDASTSTGGEDQAAPEEGLCPDLRRLLVEEGQVAQRQPLSLEFPEETTVHDLAAARARATSEVDRILAARSAEAVLGGSSREERQAEFRRLVRLLHPDKGLVEAGDVKANLAMRLCVAALQKVRRQV